MSTPPKNRTLTARDTPTNAEVHRLLMRARQTQRARDYLLILLLNRYHLSSMDIVRLRRDHIDLVQRQLLMKRGFRTVECQIAAEDLEDFKLYLESRRDLGPWMFVSRTGKPLSREALIYIIRRAGAEIGLIGLHPKQLIGSQR
jgi:type 1 fimbriae regulatory protein FimB